MQTSLVLQKRHRETTSPPTSPPRLPAQDRHWSTETIPIARPPRHSSLGIVPDQETTLLFSMEGVPVHPRHAYTVKPSASRMTISGFVGTICMTIVSTALTSNLPPSTAFAISVILGTIGVFFAVAALMLGAVGSAVDHPRTARAAMLFQLLSLACASAGTTCIAIRNLPIEGMVVIMDFLLAELVLEAGVGLGHALQQPI
ncbi:hypothetical protein K488DRAFT_69278 [Vararia minispora EC-137]|uniref:Uncharacterized protein n=1 Tax=Vararia minispora EC-137 TaxID=1314806 RepID=A0ACB8QQP6_9AGAM|nr:hypothetical protein K488DRAFT_69278 [Vararia minispora EC-137]